MLDGVSNGVEMDARWGWKDGEEGKDGGGGGEGGEKVNGMRGEEWELGDLEEGKARL